VRNAEAEFEAVRAWRAQNPDFDKRMRFAIKMSGTRHRSRREARLNTIKDMLRQKMTYRAIRAELGCGRSTILKAVDELEREGFDRAPIGRRRNA
jgi:Trp operon repressor